ncbi:hypothetical protein [Bacillus sp. FSL K6-3431]|uniref:hypothetical protein n=1 Tax=Bacillus sp. FSL K6-3431 TaxID=2921500 RepID=UPI0030FC11D8
MKKYFIIRILILLFYVACLWYGLKMRSDAGYILAGGGVVLGLVLNYINYRVNFKGKFDQPQK